MRIEHIASLYAKRKRLVTLESPAERALSDEQLLLICDNRLGISYNKSTGSYDLTGSDLGSPKHFGGVVARHGDLVDVTVFTD